MVCDICTKEGARIRYVTRSYGKGENLLIIENIPVVSCPHCGETYFAAETLHEMSGSVSPQEFCHKAASCCCTVCIITAQVSLREPIYFSAGDCHPAKHGDSAPRNDISGDNKGQANR